MGPTGIKAEALARQAQAVGKQWEFYESVIIAMDGASTYMLRYADLADKLYAQTQQENLVEVARICRKLASAPAETYHEALQATWFLFVMLQMEGNASSFSPGRMDQYLLPYYETSCAQGMTLEEALELTECLWL